MKPRSTLLAGIALASLLSSQAYSQQAPRVGAVATDAGFACIFVVPVGGEGSYSPIFPNGAGIIHVPVSQDIRMVYTSAADRGKSLSCTAQIAPGSTVSGYDPSTGQAASGVVLAVKEICANPDGAAPAICGTGGVASISSAANSYDCQLPGSPEAVAAHWRQGITHSGGYSLNCTTVPGK